MTASINDIDSKALDALIQRVSEAKEHDLSLTSDDCQLLLDALMTLATMQEKLATNDITIHKLRKLVGMVKSSEKLQSTLAQNTAKKSKKKPRTNKSKDAKAKPEVKTHKLTDLKKGDTCPECEIGNLYKYEPATLLRIVGQSPFKPEQHVMERLRCHACGAYFTAELPDAVKADGTSNQKYGYSARSIMAIAKCGMGSPYYRQGSMQGLLGVPVSASTIFDQVESLSNAIYPVFKYLKKQAANAKHYHLDDTTHRIIEATSIEKPGRHNGKRQTRTGVYTSGVIATLASGHNLTLFETNIGHAGEFIDDILTYRDKDLPKPILMSDALSHNRPTKVNVEHSLCNAHARRQFYDVMSHFQDEVDHVLTLYGHIWDGDDTTKEKGLTAKARLAYHKTHSLPIMEEIQDWCQQMLGVADDSNMPAKVEENSSLGRAMRYFLKHYDGLSMFCHIEGAQLDNNLIEGQLKLVVRDRKNAYFHKTQAGASISDVVTSLIATAGDAGINVFDYFNLLQREHEQVAKTPENYLPWNYNKVLTNKDN